MWDPSLPFEKSITTSAFASCLSSSPAPLPLTLSKPLQNNNKDNNNDKDKDTDKDVFVLQGLLQADECLDLILHAELPQHGFGRTDYAKKYRGNLRLIATEQALADALWLRMQPFVKDTVEEDGYLWEAVGLNECFRLSKYVAGDVFKTHCDTCFKKNNEEKSMYTVNIYLNSIGTDFDGGCTRFFSNGGRQCELEGSVDPVAGAALVFRQPPHSEYYHDGAEVLGGLKYLLRTDVMYKKRK